MPRLRVIEATIHCLIVALTIFHRHELSALFPPIHTKKASWFTARRKERALGWWEKVLTSKWSVSGLFPRCISEVWRGAEVSGHPSNSDGAMQSLSSSLPLPEATTPCQMPEGNQEAQSLSWFLGV